MSGITTKQKAYMYVGGANVDANYGPWSSIEEYEGFLSDTIGIDEPADATTIAIKDLETGAITKYVYESGEWRIDAQDLSKSVVITDIEQDLDVALTRTKDRVYDTQNPDGLGYKLLNSTHSIESLIDCANCIYEIRTDFVGSGTIEIPDNCVLNFMGGSINGYTILGSKTLLIGTIKLPNTVLDGTFRNELFDMQWFGLDSGAENNDAAIANTVLSCRKCGIEILVPAGTYDFYTPINFYGNFDIEMEGVLNYKGNKNATAITIGHAGNLETTKNRRFRVSVKQETPPEYLINEDNTVTVDENIGIKFVNIYESHIRIENVSNFAYCVVFSASGSGCVYNYVNIGTISNGYRLLTLYSENSEVGRSWVNENIFIGGRLWCSSACAVKSVYRAVSIGMHEDVEYKNNNNVFLKPSLEGSYIACEVLYGRYNTMLGARMERCTYGFVERNGSYGNYICNGYGLPAGDHYMLSRITKYSSLQEINSDIRLLVYRNILQYVADADNNISTKGIMQYYNNNEVQYFNSTIDNGFLNIPASRSLRVNIDTTVAKRFMAIIEGNCRLSIVCFDENGDIISHEGLVRGTTQTAFTFNSDTSVYSKSLNSVNTEEYFSVADSVKMIQIRLVRGPWRNSENVTVSTGLYKSLTVYANQPSNASINQDDVALPSVPVSFDGDITYVNNTLFSSVIGWKRYGQEWAENKLPVADVVDFRNCASDGTNGTIKGMFSTPYTVSDFSLSNRLRVGPITVDPNNGDYVNIGSRLFGKLYNLSGDNKITIEMLADSTVMEGQNNAFCLLVVPFDENWTRIDVPIESNDPELPVSDHPISCTVDDYYMNMAAKTLFKTPHWITRWHVISSGVATYSFRQDVKNIAIFICSNCLGVKKFTVRANNAKPYDEWQMAISSTPTDTGNSVSEGADLFDTTNNSVGWKYFDNAWRSVTQANTNV